MARSQPHVSSCRTSPPADTADPAAHPNPNTPRSGPARQRLPPPPLSGSRFARDRRPTSLIFPDSFTTPHPFSPSRFARDCGHTFLRHSTLFITPPPSPSRPFGQRSPTHLPPISRFVDPPDPTQFSLTVTIRQRSPTPPAPTIKWGSADPRARPPIMVPRATPLRYLNHVDINCSCARARAKEKSAGVVEREDEKRRRPFVGI